MRMSWQRHWFPHDCRLLRPQFIDIRVRRNRRHCQEERSIALQRIVQEAQGFRDSQEARAHGEAQRFISVLEAYRQAQDVTMRRIYLETMEEILRRNPKVIIDDRVQGLVPLLQLPRLPRTKKHSSARCDEIDFRCLEVARRYGVLKELFRPGRAWAGETGGNSERGAI